MIQFISLKLDDEGKLHAQEIIDHSAQEDLIHAATQTGDRMLQMFPQIIARPVTNKEMWCAKRIDSSSGLPVYLVMTAEDMNRKQELRTYSKQFNCTQDLLNELYRIAEK